MTDYFCENTVSCRCKLLFRRVTKEGPNQGREFCKCNCGKFYWQDSNGYDNSRFKNGACFRCGNYRCEIETCQRSFDWFGNLIPEDA